jgi:V-type H+-transporting ATPase proteolipid subunit
MVEAFRGDKISPFFGFLGATTMLVFSCMGAAYGTVKSGMGVASMGVMQPVLVMKSIVPVIMAGVLGIYLDSRTIKSSLPVLQSYMFFPTGISILLNERRYLPEDLGLLTNLAFFSYQFQ